MEIPMKDLPEGLIVESLLRLPVKSLLRFMCVCKAWCTVITNGYFIKMHVRRSLESNNNRSLIFEEYNLNSLYSVDLDTCEQQAAVKLVHPFNNDVKTITVLGSCNGLLCLGNGRDDIFLWNPYIRRHQKLPILRRQYPVKCESNICHNHCFPYNVFGFGYDPTKDDYKLVRTVVTEKHYDSEDSEVNVYSLSTDSWRRIRDMPFNFKFLHRDGLLVNSALHWNIRDERYSNSGFLVVSFDLKDEEYREVPLPDFAKYKFAGVMDIRELGGQLCLLVFSRYYRVNRTEIWVMKEYGVKESWVKQYTIEQAPASIRPICYSKNGEVILAQDYQALFVCDPRTGNARILRILGLVNEPVICKTRSFVGSLVLLNSKDGSDQEDDDESMVNKPAEKPMRTTAEVERDLHRPSRNRKRPAYLDDYA